MNYTKVNVKENDTRKEGMECGDKDDKIPVNSSKFQ